MFLGRKILWLIVVIAVALAMIVALKTASSDVKNSSPRGILVGRVDYYGC